MLRRDIDLGLFDPRRVNDGTFTFQAQPLPSSSTQRAKPQFEFKMRLISVSIKSSIDLLKNLGVVERATKRI
jgi:hypothetical protein